MSQERKIELWMSSKVLVMIPAAVLGLAVPKVAAAVSLVDTQSSAGGYIWWPAP